ncbi:MAG: hypothetical protein WBL95_19585 [Microcoleus sp.]
MGIGNWELGIGLGTCTALRHFDYAQDKLRRSIGNWELVSRY